DTTALRGPSTTHALNGADRSERTTAPQTSYVYAYQPVWQAGQTGTKLLATYLVVERVMPERAEPGPGADKFLTDLEMLVMAGGMERTEDEFRALLAEGGFALRRVIP